jgi:hypothetical protein
LCSGFTMADEGAERVSIADLNVAEEVSISGAEAPEAKLKEKKEKPKEEKPVVHGGGAHGGQQRQPSLAFCSLRGFSAAVLRQL